MNQLQPVNICAIIERETGQAVTAETQLDALSIDSLEFVDLLMKIEEETGKDCSPESTVHMKTVGDLLAYVSV